MIKKQPSIDAKDIQIIHLLSDNARLPVSSIALNIGMSAPSAAERIKRLEESGLISKFTIELNTELLGYPLSALVKVKPLPGQLQALEQRLIGMPACTECDKVTGNDCFNVRLVLRSISELDELLDQIADIAETSTAIIKKSPVKRRLPPILAS